MRTDPAGPTGWLGYLFDASSFVTRDQCGDWGEALPVAYRLANCATAVAYFLIPASLAYLYARRRAALPKPWMLLMFVAFIGACGVSHALNVASFYWPAYRFFTLVEVLTAAVSVAAAALLPGAVSHVAGLPSHEEYRRQAERLDLEARARDAMLRERDSHNARLRAAADEMRAEIEAIRHRIDTEEQYARMRDALHKIRGA